METTNKGTRKTIYFSEEEDKILNHALSQPSKFATYIKDLIKKDMDREPFEKTVIKIIEDYLKDKQVTIDTDSKKEIKFNNEDISALNNFLKRG